MILKSAKKLHGSTFIRYGIMAVTVVGIELAVFWLFESFLGWHYLIATWMSLGVGILLNWIGSRMYVFGSSRYAKSKEFGLVVLTSLAGVILQSGVVSLVVEILGKAALMGKIIAIVMTFFWNYFVRKRYIYKSNSESASDSDIPLS